MHWRRLKTFYRVRMPTVLHRYLSRELLLYWLIFTLVLWLVLVTARFSLYLGQAADGQLPAATVLALLGLKSVGFFVFLLPVTLYLALLWLLGRLNRDHETLALGASGVGTLQLYRAIASPVVMAALLVTLLSVYLVPYTAQAGYELRVAAQQHVDADALTPGRFHTLRGGRWLVYAQRAGAGPGVLDEVFIHVQQARPQVLVAKHAVLRREAEADRYLVLQDGYRYDGVPGEADYRVLKYREYAVRLRAQPVEAGHKWDAVRTAALLDDTSAAARSELQVRLSRPLSVLVLALLAVPLARFRPATGRFYPLWLGVLVFTLYFNLLATAQLWLAREQTPAWLGLWWVHLVFVALAVVLVRPWRSRWRRVPA